MRALSGILLVVGLLIVVFAFPAGESQFELVLTTAKTALRSAGPDLEFSPWPLATAGGLMAGVGIFFRIILGRPRRQCPSCAEPLPKAAVKCRHCGTWLSGA